MPGWIFSPKILRYVETNYVEPVDSQRLIDGAINGMLDTLDPHSSYLPPDLYKEMKIDATGEFRGLGLLLEHRDGELTVLSALDDSPARRAGIRLGDRILRIDGQDTRRMSLHEAIRCLRGEEGSRVTLTLLREGEDLPQDMALVRGKIDVTSVDGRLLADGIGYIRIRAFQDGTSADVVRLLTEEEVASGGPLARRGLGLARQSRWSAGRGRQGGRRVPKSRSHRHHAGAATLATGNPRRHAARTLLERSPGGVGQTGDRPPPRKSWPVPCGTIAGPCCSDRPPSAKEVCKR